MNRRTMLMQIAGAGISMTASGFLNFQMAALSKRKIPSSGESLPCVGVGTWQTFDAGNDASMREPLGQVLKTMIDHGATVIDSSPMYGSSEEVVGDLSLSTGVNGKLFIATKVWTQGRSQGIDQMENSFRLLRRKQIDLMQVHNLVDWEIHLQTLREWKENGRIRYIGLTHYLDSTHEKLEKIISSQKIDFIQINYSLRSRHAGERLIPAAADNGVAVLINRPFEEGALFRAVQGKKVPEWAAEFDCKTWGQFFLKFILSDPGVTCVIPGTSKVSHLLDNIAAGAGKMPDKMQREKMITVIS